MRYFRRQFLFDSRNTTPITMDSPVCRTGRYFISPSPNSYRCASVTRKNLCILFIDLDGFKAVNDTRGHAAGDELLRDVSQRIKKACRAADLSARLGGDEFSVALLHSDLEHSRLFANRLVELISQPYVFGEFQAEVSASVGISHFPSTATDADTLLRKADHAMYSAKAAGKRCVCIAT